MQEVAELLAISDERDRQLALRHQAWREGYSHGVEAGYQSGRQDEHAETAQRWAQSAREIKEHIAGTPEYRASAERRIADAVAYERRESWAHWHRRWAELRALARDPAFVREARTVRPRDRSYGQVMALLLADAEHGRRAA